MEIEKIDSPRKQQRQVKQQKLLLPALKRWVLYHKFRRNRLFCCLERDINELMTKGTLLDDTFPRPQWHEGVDKSELVAYDEHMNRHSYERRGHGRKDIRSGGFV